MGRGDRGWLGAGGTVGLDGCGESEGLGGNIPEARVLTVGVDVSRIPEAGSCERSWGGSWTACAVAGGHAAGGAGLGSSSRPGSAPAEFLGPGAVAMRSGRIRMGWGGGGGAGTSQGPGIRAALLEGSGVASCRPVGRPPRTPAGGGTSVRRGRSVGARGTGDLALRGSAGGTGGGGGRSSVARERASSGVATARTGALASGPPARTSVPVSSSGGSPSRGVDEGGSAGGGGQTASFPKGSVGATITSSRRAGVSQSPQLMGRNFRETGTIVRAIPPIAA